MFRFRLKRTFLLGIKSLWVHRLRSSLTMLGVVFGVCSVIAMLAIGEGASYEAQQQIKQLGSHNIIVKSVKPPEDEKPSAETTYVAEYGLTYDDAERMQTTIPSVKVVTPARDIRMNVWHRTHRVDAHVLGTTPWYPEIANVKVARGRFLTTTDMHTCANVCVIGHGLVRRLFPHDPPLGRHVRIGSQYYRVVGTLAPRAAFRKSNRAMAYIRIGSGHYPILGSLTPAGVAKGSGRNADNGQQTASAGQFSSRSRAASATGAAAEASDLAVYIPLTAARSRFGELLRKRVSGSFSNERVQLHELTVQVKHLSQVAETATMIDTLLGRFHEKQDYELIVPLELLRQAEQTKRIFNRVLGSIAAISLLVGGIGIMNIMLATVTERTREIGIRRALGARRRDIILQFLSETVLVSGAGGVLGLLFGVGIPILISKRWSMVTIVTPWSLALAFSISVLVGLLFGIYPAYRAAQLDPIEALRHE